MRPGRLRIGVMGSRDCGLEEARLAEQVGRLLAQRGAILICGGGGGIMEAASRGAMEADGIVVGILPSEDAASANPYVAIPIVTGIGNARNAINVLTSQSLIAISGGAGTLSEIALALKVGVPVVGLNTWDCSIAGRRPLIYTAKNPIDAVGRAVELASQRDQRSG